MKFAVLGAGGVSGNPAFCPQRCFRLSIGNPLFFLAEFGLVHRLQSSAQSRLIFMSVPRLTSRIYRYAESH